MRKNILTFGLLLVSNLFFAQTPLDKYENLEGVSCYSIDKKMFQMMASVQMGTNDIEAQSFLNMLRNLESLKVFTTSNSKITGDMKNTANSYIKSAGLEEMAAPQKSAKNIKIALKPGTNEKEIKELLVVREKSGKETETVVMLLKGNCNWDEVQNLMKKLNISLADVLKSEN